MPPPIDSKQVVDKIGESIRTYLEQASEEERHKCLAGSWNGALCVIGRAGRHVNLGLFVEHRPLLHTPCPKQAHPRAASQQDTPTTTHRPGHKSTHPKHTSTLRHGRQEPEQKEPELRHPLSEGAESEVTLLQAESTGSAKGMETDAQASRLNVME